ncbi:MAG: hypothetical protein V4773_05560 [Verrucomicrobiota bacterium]
MIIERCSDQKSQSLDEFYGYTGKNSREMGAAMLDLLAALRASADERRVWGLTSMLRLCLLSENTYKSPWHVIVAALDHRNYFIEYRMPPRLAPWPEAHVRGEARSLDDALKMVLIAMDNSEGWQPLGEKTE